MILAEGPDTVAAFIGEPILGTGGIVPPPAGYWEKIQAVLKKYDMLLVADEVVTGFGRLGTMFGSDHYGMKPDLITIAKGLTSAYAPLSGVIVSEKVWQVLVAGLRQARLARPWLDLFGASDLRRRRHRQSRTDRRAGPGRECRRDRRLFPQPNWPRPSAATPMSATCAATACWRRSNSSPTGTTACSSTPPQKIGPQVAAALLRARRHRPRHAAGRHSRLRAAALPDARGGRHRRRQNRRRGEQRVFGAI